jgi:membrane protein DedA with SNARE-associated domain
MTNYGVSDTRGAINRLLVGVLGVAVTSIIGTVGVVAVYYPLRHANFVAQWVLVFAMMVGESAAIHLPSEVILPVGGWLVVREHHLGVTGVVALSAIAAAANTIGSGMLYAAGSWGGRPLVRRYGRWFLLHERDIDAAERRMSRHRVWALFLARLLPVVRTYVGFVAGILRVPPTTFAVVTFAGSFAWCVLFVGAGALLGAHWAAIRGPAEGAGIAIVVLLVVALGAITVAQLRGRSA